LTGAIKTEVERCIRMFGEQLSCEIVELNIQSDHIHMIIMVPPKVSISEAIGTIKGRCAIRIFQKFPILRKKLYWGNHFWTKGYFVDTIGLDAEKIRKYVKFQEEKEKIYYILTDKGYKFIEEFKKIEEMTQAFGI